MKYLIIVALIFPQSSYPFWRDCCKPKASHKSEAQMQQELERITQKNMPKDEVLSLCHCQTHRKTIARLVHYSQKDSANWTLKVLEDPNSCIFIPEPDELLEDLSLPAKVATNNILYLWDVRINKLGTAKLQATFTSPEKSEIQQFTLTITE